MDGPKPMFGKHIHVKNELVAENPPVPPNPLRQGFD